MKLTSKSLLIKSAMLSLILSCSTLVAQESKPVDQTADNTGKKIDQTGINWSLPFSTANEKATTQNRLIAIKMIAGGTNKTGCW